MTAEEKLRDVLGDHLFEVFNEIMAAEGRNSIYKAMNLFAIDQLEEVYKDCIDNITYPPDSKKVDGAGKRIHRKIKELQASL